MADIELVIKIPEDVLKRTVFYREFRDLNDCVTTIKALEKAVSLPKGHGRLIDENKIKQMIEDAKVENETSKNFAENIIRFAPTIIEADKGENG